LPRRPRSRLVPYTTLFRSPSAERVGPLRTATAGRRRVRKVDPPPARPGLASRAHHDVACGDLLADFAFPDRFVVAGLSLGGSVADRKSTRLNSSHVAISYA